MYSGPSKGTSQMQLLVKPLPTESQAFLKAQGSGMSLAMSRPPARSLWGQERLTRPSTAHTPAWQWFQWLATAPSPARGPCQPGVLFPRPLGSPGKALLAAHPVELI